jgi:hypothetical protein
VPSTMSVIDAVTKSSHQEGGHLKQIEPSLLFLFGTGIIGFLSISRKRFFLKP